jgi:protein-tyrosine-phosphatase
MAEAFARMHGGGEVEPVSAGSRPAAAVNARAVAAMRERGYDLSAHRPRSLDGIPAGPYEYVVTMGCGDACPWVPAAHREDWDLPDPRALPPAEFARVRDEIERRVLDLLSRLHGGARGEPPDELAHR